MKSTTFALASLLASVALAQPHRHQQLHHKRQDVAWVTEWDYVTETVDVTETIWVSSGFVPPTSSSAPASTTSSSASSSSTAEVPAQFFQGVQSSSTSSVYVAPPPSTSVAPAPSSESPAPVVVAPVESSSSPIDVPTTHAAPVNVAPTTSSEAAVATSAADSGSSGSSSSSYGATTSGCKAGSPCKGDITFYTAGLGACGLTTDGSVDKVVALPVGLMGSQSNSNPYCGQTITIQCTTTGKTTTATVVDKCEGCTGMSIDLSNAAFDELEDESVGRTGAEWWFN